MADAANDADAALAEPPEVYRAFFLDGKKFIAREHPVDRQLAPGRVARVLARDRLRPPDLGEEYMMRMAADVRGYIDHVRSQSS